MVTCTLNVLAKHFWFPTNLIVKTLNNPDTQAKKHHCNRHQNEHVTTGRDSAPSLRLTMLSSASRENSCCSHLLEPAHKQTQHNSKVSLFCLSGHIGSLVSVSLSFPTLLPSHKQHCEAPPHAPFIVTCRCVSWCRLFTELKDGDEIAFIPPISGG